MLLQDFQPKSYLEVKKTSVPTPKFPVVDFHTHWGKLLLGEDYGKKYDVNEVVARLKAHGIRRVVNLDLSFGKDRPWMLEVLQDQADFFWNFGTVDVSRFEEKDFETMVYRSITEGVREYGMAGIKLWKPIGLGFQAKDGSYLRPDDPRLGCIFETAAQMHIPVLFHIADPVAFFSPADAYNERYEELCQHPDWSFCDPKFYRFHQLMEMQENLIAAHPNTTFVIAHVGSYAENLAQVAAWLSRFPNMYIDIAARISELGRQPYTARRFLEKYCGRVLFGTDFVPIDQPPHPTYYRFLETDDEYFNPDGEGAPYGQGRWNIYGLQLSDHALERIYYKNAEELLG